MRLVRARPTAIALSRVGSHLCFSQLFVMAGASINLKTPARACIGSAALNLAPLALVSEAPEVPKPDVAGDD